MEPRSSLRRTLGERQIAILSLSLSSWLLLTVSTAGVRRFSINPRLLGDVCLPNSLSRIQFFLVEFEKQLGNREVAGETVVNLPERFSIKRNVFSSEGPPGNMPLCRAN